MDVYFMSPPGPTWALLGRANFRSRAAQPVEAKAARREWIRLAEAIEARGGTVVALRSPGEGLTGMPYAAECGHVVRVDGKPRFVLPRMWAPHRRGEAPHWAALAAKMGVETITLPEGVTWEAQGDVAELDGATLLFWGGRTDKAGLDAVRPYFSGEVIAVQIREPAFHGNMAMLPLGASGKALVCPEVVEERCMAALRERFGAENLYEVTEAEIRMYATNGLPIHHDVLAPHLVPERVIALLASLGFNVELFEMRELCEKAGGASRCLVSIAKLAEGEATIPEEHRLASIKARIAEEDGK